MIIETPILVMLADRPDACLRAGLMRTEFVERRTST
jgi:hypothetical protein